MTKRPPGRARLFPLIFLLLFCCHSVPVSARPLSPSSYHSQIQEILALIKSRNGTLDAEEISLIRESFPEGLEISSPGGVDIRVDLESLNRWVKEARDSKDGRDSLVTYLEALGDQLVADWGITRVGGADWPKGREKLELVFQREEFKHLRDAPVHPWKEYVLQLLKRLGQWLSEVKGSLDGFSLDWMAYVAYGMVLFGGGIVLVILLRRSGPMGWRWRRDRFRPPYPVHTLVPLKHWSQWREEAGVLARQGAFREAIRALFLSILMEGHDRGWWYYEPEATNREHLARIEGPEGRREALEHLIVLYEGAWYGRRRPDRGTFQDCLGWVERMEAAA